MSALFNFDEIIDRRNTNALAIEGYQNYLFDAETTLRLPCEKHELISLWVADMAFASAPAAMDAIRDRLSHPVLGYTMNFSADYHAALSSWTREHHDWECAR